MPNEQMNKTNEIITTQEKQDKPIIYKIDDQEIKLSIAIVRNYIAKGDSSITDDEAINFMKLCQYQKLNPFLNDAYLVKYKSYVDGKDPVASTIVSKEFFMKRAQENPDYDGIQAGIIVLRDGKPIDLEGSFKLDADILVGGWAIVYLKTKKYPSVSRVSFTEYNTGKSTWKTKPLTMIRKVAEAQALREAFPKEFNGLYVEEEEGATFDRSNVVQDVKNDANKATGSTQPPKPSNEPPKGENAPKTSQDAPTGELPDIED